MLISTTELMKRLKTIEEDIKEIHSNDDESSFVPVEKYCDELITLYEATYDFELNRSKILELYEEERKIKNVLSNFNNNTKVYGYNFNINEGLIRIAELKEEIKNDSIENLFVALSSVAPKDGIYAVLGNHEYRNKELVKEAMTRENIMLLADTVVPVVRGGDTIFIAGVYDSFKYDSLAVQPSETVPDSLFAILLCHTPDYPERSASTADLVLSGHTHGGQVSLFGLYTPVKNSSYGTRFLRGRNRTSSGATIITTNGVGTSRRKVRFCVPSELVYITLKRK